MSLLRPRLIYHMSLKDRKNQVSAILILNHTHLRTKYMYLDLSLFAHYPLKVLTPYWVVPVDTANRIELQVAR